MLVSEAFHTITRLVYAVIQSRQVRQSAAENLGELTRMSMRLDQLASDLINNAKTADSLIQVTIILVLNRTLPDLTFYL